MTSIPFWQLIQVIIAGMAERKPTDDELELNDDLLDMLPDQDCRSPRPRRKLSVPKACIPGAGPERWTDTLLSSMKTFGSFRRRSRPSEGPADLIKAARDSQGGQMQAADVPATSASDAKADDTVDADRLADEPCPPVATHKCPLFCDSPSPAADTALQPQSSIATEAHCPEARSPTAAAILKSPFQLTSSETRDLTRAASNRSGGPRAPAPTPQSSNQLTEDNAPAKDVSGDAIKQVLELSAAEANKFAVLAQLLASHEVPSSSSFVIPVAYT